MNRHIASHSLPAALSPLRLAHSERRRGQALILAVLIMLLIALISAGFLVVVSGNMNQTARVGDKSRAVEAARSGLRFVNERLTYSALGERWRPTAESTIPVAGSGAYGLYYTAVDRAQGWAGAFAKFPDPLAPRTNAPTFLARVQRIPDELDAGDLDSSDASKQGALKITVIGLSPDDPAAFHKTIAYKGGQSAPLGRFMRTVTNWDFKNKVVPSATADYDNTTQILTLSNPKGAFPSAPFSVMVGDAGSSDLASAVVDSIPAAGQLHLASDPFAKKLIGVRVELAAQLGASTPLGIAGTDSAVDFNLDGAITSDEKTTLAVSDATQTKAGSARVNGGLALTGAVELPALDANAGETVRVSGLMVAPAASAQASVSTSGAPTTLLPLASGSNDATFPGAGVSTDLVADGADRLQNNAGGDRNVAPFSPPDFASGAGAGRYRELTRDSKVNLNSVTPALPATTTDDASPYGFGEGIYINNPTDRERVWDTTLATPKLRDMAQAELVQMWLSRQADGSDDTSAAFNRAGAPAALNVATASLEEQHLRGWVGPDEFHARGALVELFNDASGAPKVAITLDARSDNSTAGPNNALGPVDAKAWRDASGAVQSGVYRRVFDWPTNGVIFAEGNVRVRGTATGAPRSLTVVSQNNIYIDGSLQVNAGAKKVLLLARRNVVANPTALVSRVDGASILAATPAANSIQISDDGGLFQAGDWLSFDAAPSAPPCQVSAVSGGAITLDSVPPSVAVGTVVRAVSDPLDASGLVRTDYEKLSGLNQVLQRRLAVTGSGAVRLAFLHSAEQRPALAVGFAAGSPTNAKLTTKNAGAAGIVATSAQKVVSIQQDGGADTFDLKTATTLTAFATSANSQTPQGAPVWNYQFAAQSGYDNIAPIALAGVGNRRALDGTSGTYPSQNVLGGGANDKNLFVATSVAASVGGSAAPLLTDQWGSAPTPVSAFGFAPDPAADEDVLTGDASFYVPDAGAGAPQLFALDSRAVNVAPGQTFALSLGRKADGTPLVGFDADPAAANHLPFYRLGALKLEDVQTQQDTSTPPNVQFKGIKPVSMDIHAFVYAQTGSWFVIPAPRFDAAARNGDDADRNGTVDGSDAVNAYRFGRYNYKVAFTGAIAENQTALVDAAGTVPGAVQIWSDSWANVDSTITEHNAGVAYTFDPDYAAGTLNSDAGFVMPQSDELTYVE